MQGLPGRPGDKGSPGEPVSTEIGRKQPVLSPDVPLTTVFHFKFNIYSEYCVKERKIMH